MENSFYIVALESGAENPAIPTWACREENPATLGDEVTANPVRRVELEQVPGGYQLLNVLNDAECDRLVELSERLGYQQDAAVSLPREIRHNDNFVWIADDATERLIWKRVAPFVAQRLEIFDRKKPLGLNCRFRFYRYDSGDYFKPHTDGAWPGSKVINGRLVTNAYPDRYSLMTFLVFLNGDFDGGATRFFIDKENPSKPSRFGAAALTVDVRTPKGGVLCFPHGLHPLHCIHSSEPITRGLKYIIRTDLLFEL